MPEQPIPSVEQRYPYCTPTPASAPSIQPRAVTRRADQVRAEIEAAQRRLAPLQARQRELLRQFPARSEGEDNPEADQHAIHVRTNAAQIVEVEIELAALGKRLTLATELDAEEGAAGGLDDFEGHLAAGMRHLQSRSKAAGKLEQAFAQIRDALQAYEAAGESAAQHLSAASQHLPRRQRLEMVHKARGVIVGGPSIYALMTAASAAGLGTVGIRGGILLDNAHMQVPAESFESALAKCNRDVAGQLDYWRKVAKGETAQPAPLDLASAELQPSPPAPINWATMVEIPVGGQRPGFHSTR